MLPERGNQCRAALHTAQPVSGTLGGLAEGAGTEVAKLVLLQVSPDVFRWVEFWRVGRQILQLNRSVETLYIVANHLTAMRGEPVPDHQHSTANVPSQGLQELDDL